MEWNDRGLLNTASGLKGPTRQVRLCQPTLWASSFIRVALMEYAVKVHQSGPWKGLPVYEECLQEVSAKGARTNIVAKVSMTDGFGESGTLCRGVITGQSLMQRVHIT